MRFAKLGVLVLGLALMAGQVGAADLVLTEEDCIEILKRWAEQPDSVPQELVDKCRDLMADMGTPEETEVPASFDLASDAIEPCADNRVDCWGPWGQAPRPDSDFVPIVLAALPLELRPEDSDTLTPDVPDDEEPPPVEPPPIEPPPPVFPLGGCEPGLPCGFATLVDGVGGHAPSEATIIVPFFLAADGSAFIVDPETLNAIASVLEMETSFVLIEGIENMRSSGDVGDVGSRLIARVFRAEDGDIEKAADYWAHGNAATGEANSGFFAWGVTTPQADLDRLNNGGEGISVSFAGAMSVDNSTDAAITVEFGVAPVWRGNWTNPAYAFDAGGGVSGVNLLSDPSQFSPNIDPEGSYVQGALVGPAGDQAIVHAIDVNIRDFGNVKDVGLLPQVTPLPPGLR